MDPQHVTRALYAAAPPVLQAWIVSNMSAVLSVAGTLHVATPAKLDHAAEAARRAGWTLPAALSWLHRAVDRLLDSTVVMDGRMVKDEIGASVGTLGTLRGYAGRMADAPIEEHLRALEVLRYHKQQVGAEDFDAAYATVKRAFEQEIGQATISSKFSPVESPKSGLRDGAHYRAKGADFMVKLPFKRGEPTPKALLLEAGFVANVHYRWFIEDTGGKKEYWIVANAAYALAMADALEKWYPNLAEALRANAPVWMQRAGVTPKTPGPIVADSNLDPSTGYVVDPGKAGRFDWRMAGRYILVRLPYPKQAALRAGLPVNWHREEVNGETQWWLTVRRSEDELDKLRNVLKYLGRPAAESAMDTLVPAWLSQVEPEQTQDTSRTAQRLANADPTKPEIPFDVTAGGYVRLYMPYSDFKKTWINANNLRAVVTTRFREVDGKKVWYEYFKGTRAWMVVDGLAERYPNTAAALLQRFGSEKRTFDEDALTCNPLVQMGKVTSPAEVTTPAGRAALEDVIQRLRARLPLNPATGKQLWPYPYQLVGIAFAKLTGYRTLIADAPGLGKTIQALGSIVVDPDQLLPAVVVAPASVALKWRAEIQGGRNRPAWMPGVPTHVLRGLTKKQRDAGVDPLPPKGWRGIMLVTWAMLPVYAEQLAAWGVRFVIADESHYAKNPDSKRTQALATLAENVPHIMLLSGTALKNNAIELHTQLSMIEPETYGSRTQFGQRFADTKTFNVGGKQVTQYVGVKNPEVLKQLMACTVVRRLKSHVLEQLPPKRREMQPIELDEKEIAEYNRVVQNFPSWIFGEKERKYRESFNIEPKTTLTPDQVEAVNGMVEKTLKSEPLVKIGYMRRAMGLAKVPAAVEFILAFVEAEEPVVVFAEHQRVVAALESALRAHKVRVTKIGGGETISDEERQRRADDFQAGKYDVFIGTSAAHTGIDLFRASNTIFVERFWTPADEEQAEDRIHRIGQKRAATIHYLYVPDTIDEKINALIESKRSVSDRVLGGESIKTTEQAVTSSELLADIVNEAMQGKPRRKNAGRRAATADVNVLPNPQNVQSLIFDKRAWTRKTASHWAKMHGFTVNKIDDTGTVLRLRQHDPRAFVRGSFRTIKFTPTVSAVVAEPGRA